MGKTSSGEWAPYDPYRDSEGEGYQPPEHLRVYWKHFDKYDTSRTGFVCPCCKNVWSPAFAGMPGSFEAHVEPHQRGQGCFFKPKQKGESTQW